MSTPNTESVRVVLDVLDRANDDLRPEYHIDPKVREDLAFEIALAIAAHIDGSGGLGAEPHATRRAAERDLPRTQGHAHPTGAAMTDRRITLEVSEEHGGIQLSINETDKNGSGSGYRLFGPKFSGGSTLLRSHTLDARDVAEIRRYLDRFDELSAAGAEGDNHD